MAKRPRDSVEDAPQSGPLHRQASHDGENAGSQEDADGSALKKARSFMATLACDACRSRKTRCDEDRPRCAYCRSNSLECTYQTPRATKKDQSMAVAINAIRRLESKIENLTAAVRTAAVYTPKVPRIASASIDAPVAQVSTSPSRNLYNDGPSPRGLVISPRAIASEHTSHIALSFSQHRVAIWPAIQQVLPTAFTQARVELPQDYVVEIELSRPALPVHIDHPYGTFSDSWLMSLPQGVLKGLADAYFAVFHRITPILDKYFFFSNTLGAALENDFGYDIESCLVLVVLALGCLAVKAHEEGDFALPSRVAHAERGFVRPDWYELTVDEPPGLKFMNEARSRLGFLMCQTDLQSGQFYMLSTSYYAQILRPLDSWTTVNRAALCCMTILGQGDKRPMTRAGYLQSNSTAPATIDFEEWEGDMLSRLYWNTLMYETVLTKELDLLPHSGLLHYEANVPLPKFTSCPRPKTSIAGLLTDDDDSFFSFHFLAQAAHRIILTRVTQSLYYFAEKEGFPSAGVTSEMHHQLEQWRANLPVALQFSDDESFDDLPSPAHVIAKAMLRCRYLVAKFHIGRPFLYKALHAPEFTTDAEYDEVRKGLRGGMYWPTTMGLCAEMLSALPLKFGWCCQCFGQVLLFHAVVRSPDQKLRNTLPDGWQEWVRIMTALIESCGRDSPGIAKDAELLRLL